MGNVGIYSVGVESVYQIIQSSKTECLAGRPFLRDTRETQLSPFVLTLRILVMCRAHALLRGMLSREIPAKTSLVFNSLSLHTHSLSITQPLQSNLTINTRYKRKIEYNYNQIWHGIKANKQHLCKSQLYIFFYLKKKIQVYI